MPASTYDVCCMHVLLCISVQGPPVVRLDVRAGPALQDKQETQAMQSLALLSATVAGDGLHQYE